MTLALGQSAEQQALDYLANQGLQLVARNYRCRLGEIDLIMKDKLYLIFIEVRARVSKDYGGGLGSITYAKRQKIIKTTAHYLLTQNVGEQQAIRFDVVSIDGRSSKLTWVKDAFNVDY